MPSEDNEILQFYQYQKSDKAPFITNADLRLLFMQNSSTIKVDKHIPSGFSTSTISSFRSIENKHDLYKDKDCTKKFCEFLREYEMKIINFREKEVKLLIKEQQESYENAKICYIC